MYRIMILDTERIGNNSSYKFQLNKSGEIKEYESLADLDKAVEDLLETVAKKNVIPVEVIDYTIDANIDTMSV